MDEWRGYCRTYAHAIQRHCNGWAIRGLLLESDAGRHAPVRLPATRLVQGPRAEDKPTNVMARAFQAGPCPLYHFEIGR